MRIGIDATNWSNPRGYGRYARGVLTALLAQPDRHQFTLFVDNHTYAQKTWPLPAGAEIIVINTGAAPTEAASASGRRSLADMWAMAAAVSRAQLDVVYFPSIYTYFPIRTQAQILVGIHDIIAENYPELVFTDRKQRFFWNLKSWLARRQADYIVTVSDHAQAGIVRHFRWPQERAWVVGEAPDPIFRPMDDPSAIHDVLVAHNLTAIPRYLICLGGLNPHKNLTMLFEVLAEMRQEANFADLHLVLVGPAESDSFTPGAGKARSAIVNLHLDGAVHLTGFIPDEDVVCLLNEAQALVMPSFDEGYGLGSVEAAACGTPVIATTSSPLPRLLSGGGYFIDPHQPAELKEALRRLLSDEAQQRQMGQIALARARELTWTRAADQFRELLAHIEAKTA